MSNYAVETGRKTRGISFWRILGGTALFAVIAGLIMNLSDIKRYIKISRM